MQPTSLMRTAVRLAALSLMLLAAFQAVQAQTETVLYNFGANSSDANYPESTLTPDNSGNLYGTTPTGGANGGGTVFELNPEPPSGCPGGSNSGNGWCETVLYNFCAVAPNCADGYNPYIAYVTFDASGNLYGTAEYGGANGDGTVFELSPEPLGGCSGVSNPGNGWCEIVLYSFCSLPSCTDGSFPANGLVWDSSGNLYGTTNGNGEQQGGSVFELSPNGMSSWTEQVIYPVYMGFTYAGLAIDASGNLYGVDGNEDVFKLSFANGVWIPTNIHTFTGGPKDGSDPFASTPALDSAGNVYGTTQYGGSKGYGTVWKLTPVTSGKKAGTYKEKILHSFTSEKTGEYPAMGVTLDSSGNIYDTTPQGGKYGDGTVFELVVSGTTYKYKLLWSFNNTDGNTPFANPILDSSGNLYGTANLGGANDNGTVFEVTP